MKTSFNYFSRIKPATATRKNSALVKRNFAITHSAVYRSTEFYSRDATQTIFPKNGNPYQRIDKHSREVFSVLTYWSKFGDEAIDGLVGAIFDNLSIEDCEHTAIAKRHPEWTFSSVKYRGNLFTATLNDGKFQTRISALSWQQLNEKLS